MRVGETYQLSAHALAIQANDGRTIVDLPSGAIVTVADSPPEDMCFLNVVCRGTELMMFRTDLRERGKLVKTAMSADGRSRVMTA